MPVEGRIIVKNGKNILRNCLISIKVEINYFF